tara:strand:+ start:19138 stop:19791 length:654 start_codon:yes stop_codon:yes gene_type:complete
MEFKQVKNFLIDMDGVILDIKYDHFFWQEHMPMEYAKKNDLSLIESKKILHQIFYYKTKTKDWYDLDYWSNMIGIDVLKEKNKKNNMDKIKLNDDAIDFLQVLKKLDKKVFLITNAHKKTLDLKMSKFPLNKYFDNMICSHELNYVKEEIPFWYMLKRKLNINFENTVLIEDTYENIKAAYLSGINNFIYISEVEKQNNEINMTRIKSLKEISSAFK